MWLLLICKSYFHMKFWFQNIVWWIINTFSLIFTVNIAFRDWAECETFGIQYSTKYNILKIGLEAIICSYWKNIIMNPWFILTPIEYACIYGLRDINIDQVLWLNCHKTRNIGWSYGKYFAKCSLKINLAKCYTKPRWWICLMHKVLCLEIEIFVIFNFNIQSIHSFNFKKIFLIMHFNLKDERKICQQFTEIFKNQVIKN